MTGIRWVWVTLAAFLAGLALFPPRLLLVVDEEQYVGQAMAFARGALSLPESGLLFPPASLRVLSDYPPGTSLLQAPFVAIGGWRMAVLASVLALIVATLATVRWLRAERRDAGFAMLVPAFLGTAFFGRLAMSDVPATAIVALAALLTWTADRAPWRSMFAGATAGSLLLFREPVLVLLVPLLAGAVVRRSVAPLPLIAGLLLSVALRLLLSDLLFGSAWHLRDPGYGFTPSSLAHTIPMYAVILGVLVPAGVLLPVCYRGPRRSEVTLGVIGYVSLFLLFEYDAARLNGSAKGLVLMSRYMAPAMPFFAFMAADVWPRWFASISAGVPVSIRSATAIAGIVSAAAAFLVHPIAARQEAATLPIASSLQANTSRDVPVVTNLGATLKYLGPVTSPRRLIALEQFPADSLPSFVQRHGKLTVAVLDRFDSPIFSERVAQHDAFLAQAATRCTVRPVLDERIAGMRLRVAEASSCR